MPGRTYWQCEPEELKGLTIEQVERTPLGDVFLLSDGTCLAFVPVRNAGPGPAVKIVYERSRPSELPSEVT